MNNRTTEDIISALYDTIQDARSMPLSSDKCIIERDRVLDMLDEIIAQLPAELKQSRTIVESRNELISQARREAESIIRQAHEQAQQMVSQEAIYNEAKRRSEELAMQLAANGQIATQYVDLAGNPTMDAAFNPNGSLFAIEGITSPDGRVFGKMGHSERIGNGLYKNVPGQYNIRMFEAAVKYFK